MQRIGILGGTFDPIHIGHMEMAREAAAELARLGEPLDRMLIIPAGNPYFKGDITPYEMRCEMVGIAVDELNAAVSTGKSGKDCFRCELSYLEKDEGKPTYTYETLLRIHQDEPDITLYFICGEDVYDSIHMWRKPDVVLDEAALVVFERKQSDRGQNVQDPDGSEEYDQSDIGSEHRLEQMRKINKNARIIPIRSNIPPISSTQIRKLVSEGNSIVDLVPAGVSEYIREHSLYRS